jgi:hypothetical protein
MTSSDHLPPNYTPPINTPLVHIATGQVFRVLCNCRNMTPAHHTQRFVAANPTLFRHPTAEELTP